MFTEVKPHTQKNIPRRAINIQWFSFIHILKVVYDIAREKKVSENEIQGVGGYPQRLP